MGYKIHTTTQGVPFVETNWGPPVFLGCKPPDPSFAAGPDYAESFPVLTAAELTDNSLKSAVAFIRNQGSVGSCFPAGTLVRMEDGSERPIDQIHLLDKVLTAEGNVGEVQTLFVRHHVGDMVRLWAYGHSHLRMTPEHPVLTRRGYVEAANLNKDDWVCLPRYAPQHGKMIQVADHVEMTRTMVKQTNTTYTRYAGVVGRAAINVQKAVLPDVIHLTKGFGRIIGLFLAEGNTDYAKIVWTFSIDEEHTLVAELVSLLKSELGIDAHVATKARNNTTRVSVYGIGWAKLFESLCSSGAGKKTFHPSLSCGSAEFLAAVLSGWLDGDGHKMPGKPGYRMGTTISKSLAVSMYDIAQFLGMRPVLRWRKVQTNKYAKTRQPSWHVIVAEGDHSDTHRSEMKPDKVWRRVIRTEREQFSGPVYNLEVAGDNSYVAEGVAVHNCASQATAGGMEVARLANGKTYRKLSAVFMYAQVNGGVDQGSRISDMIACAKSMGTCLYELGPDDGRFRKNQFSSDAYKQASRFRVLDAFRVRTFEEMCSALSLGRPVVSGFACGANFTKGNWGDNEVAPLPDQLVGGHAVLHVGIKIVNGVPLIETVNSWAGWNRDGCTWMRREHWDAKYGFPFEAYAIVNMMDDPQDTSDDIPSIRHVSAAVVPDFKHESEGESNGK